MEQNLPNARTVKSAESREKLRRVMERRGLCGLANDTKWDELLAEMRAMQGWRPSYRCKCIDSDHVSGWDVEWFYHLPFPFQSVEWLDVAHLQEVREHRLPPRVTVIDHGPKFEEMLKRIGLEYQKGEKMIRIFGYSPKRMERFDEEEKSE